MNSLAIVLGLVLVCAVLGSNHDKKGDDHKGGKDDKDEGPSKELNAGGARVKCAGKSGKIMFWRERSDDDGNNSTGKGPKKTPPIIIFFEKVDETKADGSIIGDQKGNGKHQFKGFKDVTFSLGEKKAGTIPGSAATADYIEMDAALKDGKKMKLKVYIAKTNGTITVGGETTDIWEGNMKFSLELSDWEWCTADTCDGDVGAFVDVTIAVGIPAARKANKKPKAANKGQRFDLGEDAFMDFSQKVQLDNAATWSDMPADYPKLDSTDPKRTLIVLRFPKFNSTALYDPTGDSGTEYMSEEDIDTSEYDPSETEETSGADHLAFSFLASSIMAAIALMLHR